MAKNNKIQLFRTETSGLTTDNILKGELALNINSSSPFVMFKDTSGAIQKLGSLTSSTGTSIFHTMTQKAITDALTSGKNETDTVFSALNSEIAARKAIDGQTGQTYVANTNATHISGASSLNDADIKLSNAIIAETKARQDAINAMNTSIENTNGNFDISVVQTNGLLSSMAISDIALSSSYVAVTYPKVDSATFTAAVSGDTLDKAVAKVEQNVATLVQEVLNNKNVVAAALTKHNESAGFDENANYVKDLLSTHISGATTLSEADSLLSDAISNLNTWCAYMSGHTTVTTLTSVPITKRMCVATISASQTLGIAGRMTDGREMHIIVKNSGSSEITITIPSILNSKTCINMSGEDLKIQRNSYGEINLLFDGINYYYRGAAL